MNDTIKALIAAAESFAESHQGCTCWSKDEWAERDRFRSSIAAAKAAAEARPEPKLDPMARDWTVDFAHENGNYENHCIVCKQKFYGDKRRTTCRVCATARPEPAAEPSTVPVLLREARDAVALRDNQMAMFRLCDAVEALAREKRQ